MLCFRLSITSAQMLKEPGIVRKTDICRTIYIMSNCSATQKKTLFYPSKFDSQLEAANILTSYYLLVLSMIRKSYTPALRRKNVVRQSQYCAPKMAYFRTKLSLSGQNLQLSDKILKILAQKTITYEKFYVRFAIF